MVSHLQPIVDMELHTVLRSGLNVSGALSTHRAELPLGERSPTTTPGGAPFNFLLRLRGEKERERDRAKQHVSS